MLSWEKAESVADQKLQTQRTARARKPLDAQTTFTLGTPTAPPTVYHSAIDSPANSITDTQPHTQCCQHA